MERGDCVGVPGRDDRVEWMDARDVGRDGRLIGVKKRKGTYHGVNVGQQHMELLSEM